MANYAEKPIDLVLSYTVTFHGVPLKSVDPMKTSEKTNHELQAALDAGYRVVDMRTDAITPNSGSPFVVVTVILTAADMPSNYRGHKPQ